MDCGCALPWIGSACRARGLIAWEHGLANGVLWVLRDFLWGVYLFGGTSEPICMVGVEGKIKVVGFFLEFSEWFCSGLVLSSEEN